MKIGQFASKYHLKPSTIRYYIDRALLTPRRINGQYIFDNRCMEEMNKVMEYKKHGFSLEEIELLLYYENSFALQDPHAIDEIVHLIQGRTSKIDREIQELKKSREDLLEKIKKYKEKKESITYEEKSYVPIEALDILCCPSCNSKLTIKEANIETSGISKGILTCPCGYKAQISDGVVLCQGYTRESPLKTFENVDSFVAMTEDFSSPYRTLMEKSYLWLYQKLENNKSNCDFILTGPMPYNFFPLYMNKLSQDPLYIITDISSLKIEKMREYFADMRRKILFIASPPDRLPIKRNSIDFYIDDFSSSNYMFAYNRYIFPVISPYLKEKGIIAGCFVDYSKAPKSLENFRKDHKDFKPELMNINKFYKKLSDSHMNIEEEKSLGSPQGRAKNFLRQEKNEEFSLMAYLAKKDE